MLNAGFTRAAKKYLKPGKYARRLIPARSTSSRLNKKERRVLNKIGNKYGCPLGAEGTLELKAEIGLRITNQYQN
ncbi:hypothetical protein [Bacillus amyloliquefaciens]|uniref:hypothetical protein n=1 Tax=Bacillus amyloliquefaciens TaxID=1390 RepID=UPI0012DB3BF0|nr:hypothetical protein [Bacillus amyloliquefaciens]